MGRTQSKETIVNANTLLRATMQAHTRVDIDPNVHHKCTHTPIKRKSRVQCMNQVHHDMESKGMFVFSTLHKRLTFWIHWDASSSRVNWLIPKMYFNVQELSKFFHISSNHSWTVSVARREFKLFTALDQWLPLTWACYRCCRMCTNMDVEYLQAKLSKSSCNWYRSYCASFHMWI